MLKSHLFTLALLCLIIVLILIFAKINGFGLRNANPLVNKNHILIMKMRNSDLHWDGDISGLTVSYDSQFNSIINLKNDVYINSLLLDALEDDSRIAISHVILTEMYGLQRNVTSRSWNGLYLEMTSHGEIRLDKNCYIEIRKYWEARIGKRPVQKL